MSKFRATISFGNGDSRKIGEYASMSDAAEHAWDFAYDKGYTRSSCENHDSVVEALTERNYCMLGYGPDCLEVEEIAK